MRIFYAIVMAFSIGIGMHFGIRTANWMDQKYQTWAENHFGASLLIAYCAIFVLAVGGTLAVVFLVMK